MKKAKVSGQILSSIYGNSNDNTVVEFLRLLCWQEAEHPGQWKWKEEYMKQLEKFVSNWGGHYEDKSNNSKKLSAI